MDKLLNLWKNRVYELMVGNFILFTAVRFNKYVFLNFKIYVFELTLTYWTRTGTRTRTRTRTRTTTWTRLGLGLKCLKVINALALGSATLSIMTLSKTQTINICWVPSYWAYRFAGNSNWRRRLSTVDLLVKVFFSIKWYFQCKNQLV